MPPGSGYTSKPEAGIDSRFPIARQVVGVVSELGNSVRKKWGIFQQNHVLTSTSSLWFSGI